MRPILFLLSLGITVFLIWVLNIPLELNGARIPKMGMFLSPQHGFWQNAEPADVNYNARLQFNELEGNAQVYIDDRLVPHVFAEKERDLYFIQGYLHAKFRLWQMEVQTHAAAGRLSEVLGKGADGSLLNFDRQMRRLGMVYAAEKSVKEIENNPQTKMTCDAYTAGINAYIRNMRESELPVEYKLLNYKPEPWSNFKTALFLKYMSYDLAGAENDFEMTNAKAVFSQEQFEQAYPVFPDSLDPIVPKGSSFAEPGTVLLIPAIADSVYFNWKNGIQIVQQKPAEDNGSNSWVVGGTRTKSGKPILCNDPHLGLNLPSLWFEMQLSCSGFNAYGASFPGGPNIIIGFNDSCAWGFTNAMRDVRDYYEIQFRDDSMQEYWFDSSWHKAELRVEEYKIAGGEIFRDTVAYTVFGPVMYDKRFSGAGKTDGKYYAVRWKAHDPSNDLLIFNKLNHAKNYSDYEDAIQYLSCPGQNCTFASVGGDIAIWQQADFPAKWHRQGDFVMPGTDSSFMWQGLIPQKENPHHVNPDRGFVSSANQLPVDKAYPYYIGGYHDVYRGIIINRYLAQITDVTIEDMQHMQNDNFNVLAETALPLMMKYVDRTGIDGGGEKYLNLLSAWNLRNDAGETGPTLFNLWFEKLKTAIWQDELDQINGVHRMPEDYTTIEALLKDSAFSFIDNVNTPEAETIVDIMTTSFNQMIAEAGTLEASGDLTWGRFKNTGIEHLLKLSPLSSLNLNNVGGGKHVINATKKNHGQSWKMIVELTDEK
ncbi:MAG TPA: penicillin acylase family protein, partial [Parasegetibacter sp.]